MEKRWRFAQTGKSKSNKKAQVMGMPFQFIFAIILIAITIFVGFYIIRYFLRAAETANINSFVVNFQQNVEGVWQQHEEASKLLDLDFSKNFNYVCFVNRGNCNLKEGTIPSDLCSNTVPIWSNTNRDNMFLYPGGKAEAYKAKTAWHIKCGTRECLNVTKTICFPVEEGKVKIRLVKESGEPVKLAKP
ncbi:MAG: hypothetical protein K6T16_00325 [Candidatus Pacearchaeota archaeon]|nr:hypothetical protein [Candidatus Pacearchaeota archaeon]